MTDPPRFDPYIDTKAKKLPGPSTYSPNHKVNQFVKSYSSAKSERMKAKRYHTDVPGAGTYRMQPELGVYSASDTKNNLGAAVDENLNRNFSSK